MFTSRRLKRYACTGIIWALKLIFQLVFVVAMFVLLPIAEGKFYPVVSDITNVTVEQTPTALILNFSANKIRQCRFDEVTGLVKVDGSFVKAKVTFLETYNPRTGNETRPIGSQVFGPWKIEPKGTELILASRHTCNALWDTETQLVHWTAEK